MEMSRATLKEVASLAGVSATTVSRVLAGNYPVARGTRQRVMSAVQELNYVANSHARALRGMETPQVGFVLASVLGQPFAHAVMGAEREAARHGYVCMVGFSDHNPQRELTVLQSMRERSARAVILIGGVVDDEAYRERMVEIARGLDQAGSRLVLCGRPPLAPDVPTTVIEYDNEGGAYAATGHLLSQGHKRILYLGGDPAHTTTAGRLAGYRRALATLGGGRAAEMIERVDFNRPTVYERMRRLSADGPAFTAVFAETDLLAAAALNALLDSGLDVPGDVSVVGYDDSELAADVRPKLTSVRVPYEELGRLALSTALGLRDNRFPPADQHQVLGTSLVLRDSVGPPRAMG
ncbi:LacI family DNA-binding transcriptional regulator [Streptomyces sp. VNUA24]|uniref:LacI family DNA-binding transcriptional regulator n=1 Tax=Streptomyces sp. VNUA24 TaxID=3031131 RepID=UPI0023B82F4C|nr:LacI family DNA-binding transcriptional regulator [Streptomyces sp. VNUA24]WEH13097.1 LacI family DNA-binding transcriptional regulator [Streptomyces sp. VNUA24]